MPIAKDALTETSAGVLLTAHTPNGSGAAGGPWLGVAGALYQSPISIVLSGGFKGIASKVGTSYMSGAGTTAGLYVQCVITINTADTYAGVMLLSATTGTGVGYQFTRTPGAWKLYRTDGSTNTDIGGTISSGFSLGTSYTLKMSRTNAGVITCYINGTQVCQVTDTVYSGTLYPGISGYDGANVIYLTFEGDVLPSPPVLSTARIAANVSFFQYQFTAATDGTGPYTYTLQKSADGSTGWTDVATVSAATVTATNASITAGSTWYFRIKSTDSLSATTYSNVVTWVAPSYCVIFDGNSLTAGYASSDSPGPTSGPAYFPARSDGSTIGKDPGSQALSLLPYNTSGGWCGYNIGIGSQKTTDMISRLSSYAYDKIDACIAAGGTPIVVAWEIGNELYFAASHGSSTQTTAQTNWTTYCNSIIARGAKLVVVGLPARTSSGATNPTGFTTDVTACDTWLRSNWRNLAHGYIDLRNYQSLAALQTDGTHYGDSGYALIGQLYASAAMEGVSGGTSSLTGGRMTVNSMVTYDMTSTWTQVSEATAGAAVSITPYGDFLPEYWVAGSAPAATQMGARVPAQGMSFTIGIGKNLYVRSSPGSSGGKAVIGVGT